MAAFPPSLGDCGVTEAYYRPIEKARLLVDEVNIRLRQRGVNDRRTKRRREQSRRRSRHVRFLCPSGGRSGA